MFALTHPSAAVHTHTGDISACQGYRAVDVEKSRTGLSATLELIGQGCNAFGPDYPRLNLDVSYDNRDRLRVRISDSEGKAHVVPPELGAWPKPGAKGSVTESESKLKFHHVAEPFSFSVTRGQETLFNTSGNPLIFEEQYVRLKTSLSEKSNIYGLGDHNDRLRLPIKEANYSRTFWARDAFGLPARTNLYGSHPVYFDHRLTDSGPSTHGVFLLSSQGMDVKFPENGTSLEYNTLGGVLDLFFLNGPTPEKVAAQYTDVVGKPVGSPYWGLGFHQCRYGYDDWIEVAEVIANYSKAGIPLETQWIDIDYMDDRAIFTTNPDNYPLEKVREIVANLHSNDQHFVVMIDPAMAVREDNYPSFQRAKEQGTLLKTSDGQLYNGVVWPGRTVFPDWFAENTTEWWKDEFKTFFDPEEGIDVDAIWIDMNEPASFLPYLEANPDRLAGEVNQWLYPPYRINDVRAAPSGADGVVAAGSNAKNISDFTARTDLVSADGQRMYDVHNIYGYQMGLATREALLARRQGLRPLIITRSTFAGSGNHTGKWLGDNLSTWGGLKEHIAQMLGFTAIYGIPMVGADTCGFGGNTTETLCARWATLGAFNPFYRNHNQDKSASIPQEFYRWPLTTEAAKNAIDIRYRLLDYLYTALHFAERVGEPVASPLFYKHPEDEATFDVDTQFYFGPSLLVSPVLEENVTRAEFYLPEARYYEFKSLKPVEGRGANVTLEHVPYTEIPLHVLGGSVIPLRSESTYTTTELRSKHFTLVVAPDQRGSAKGRLRLDDGVSIVSESATDVRFRFSHGKHLHVEGEFGYQTENVIESLVFAGIEEEKQVEISVLYDPENKTLTVSGLSLSLLEGFDAFLV
ncbi:alpha-glucosidase [Violaceomyces palustris]|uniref:Alpha-glucosidase n=1 Tax=Violaceomyces palustris TaxID=1673888 RepID=A0ACD0NYS8_9BASI|nr:alpha-glucosidase [Violaceomyces palustris]